MIFLFPDNIILFFIRKIKGDLSQKNTCEYDVFCKYSGKMVFPKNSHWNVILIQLSGKMVFLLPGNMISFFIALLRTDMFKSYYIITIYVFSKSNLYRYVLLKCQRFYKNAPHQSNKECHKLKHFCFRES